MDGETERAMQFIILSFEGITFMSWMEQNTFSVRCIISEKVCGLDFSIL